MVDVVQGWTVEQAIRMGRALAPYDLFWIEDPVLFDDLEGMARIGRGARHADRLRRERLFEAGLRAADRPRRRGFPDAGPAARRRDHRVDEGRGHGRRGAAADRAARLPRDLGAHGRGGAQLPHLEYVPWWDRLFREPVAIVDGTATPPDRPGLGLEFDWT